MSPSNSFLAKKTYTWFLSIGGEVVGKIQNKTIYPWDQPGFVQHRVSPSELMFQIEADELYDHYKNYRDVYYLLAKKYPDSSIAQARINHYTNQPTLAEFVGPPNKQNKIPKTVALWNEPSVVQTPADQSYKKPKVQYYEVYVIKNHNNRYWSNEAWAWINSLLQCEHFTSYEAAKQRCEYLDFNVQPKVLKRIYKFSVPILLEEVKEEVEEEVTDDDVLI